MMQPLATACPSCGDALEAASVLARGDRRGVSVAIEEAPCRRCPNGHGPFDLRPGFADEVVADVMAMLTLPRRRWWSRKPRCGACDELLTMPARRTTRSVTVDVPGAPVFTVTMDLAMDRCPACGIENLADTRSGRTEAAVRSAMADRGLGHAFG